MSDLIEQIQAAQRDAGERAVIAHLEATMPTLIAIAGAARVETGSPIGYRLTRDTCGVLTLQGAYHWRQGSDGGHEWRDIPTVQV